MISYEHLISFIKILEFNNDNDKDLINRIE